MSHRMSRYVALKEQQGLSVVTFSGGAQNPDVAFDGLAHHRKLLLQQHGLDTNGVTAGKRSNSHISQEAQGEEGGGALGILFPSAPSASEEAPLSLYLAHDHFLEVGVASHLGS